MAATVTEADDFGGVIDVIDAQTALDVANTNLVNAETAVAQARAAYARATGAGLQAVAGE